MDYAILKSLFIVLVLGFMIGMQRTMTYLYKGEQAFAGSRTFALIALGGFLSGWIEKYVHGFVLASTLVFASMVAISYIMKVKQQNKWGMTTQIAALVTFFLGVMVWYHLENYAIFIGVVIIVLLEIKPRLQQFETHISPTDIHAVTLLLAMSFIVLPVLPDEMVGPYHLFNPYKTWLMAVIIAGISFIGYVAIKVLGQKHGVFLTGAAGGLISSTAVSISLSRMFRHQYTLINNYAGGIAVASTFMYFRVLFEAFVIHPELAWRLTPAYMGAALSGLAFSYWLYIHSKAAEITFEAPAITKNPLQLSEAIKFGILFGIVYGAIAFVQTRYGNVGVYVVSLFSGITDVDAITLSLSQMAKEERLETIASMNGIVIASVVNSLVKLGIVYWLGGVKLGWRMTQFFVLTLGVMGAGLFIGEMWIP
ncbi:MgtC/SapB family protein [Hydrogenimonas cancrithermarum]|uniref:MgtC/SapB transporter n=1 Tax=Hydrogenimonas cancrithermarum TaxID=2993563 RepID=A0ABN6WUG2_9BACT|nr:MgtC/SapB family protein [Hydrogenimonas cancrithermarum]BDY12518.1 MgtC/SapB transporter [Hydrogenimonas cancrithermarum]